MEAAQEAALHAQQSAAPQREEPATPQPLQQHGQQNGTHAAAPPEASSPHTPHPGAKPRPVAPQPKSAPPWDRRRRPNGISNSEGGGGCNGATRGSLDVEGGAGSEGDALIPSGGGGRLSRSSSREGLAARSPAARVVLKRSASGRRLVAESEPRTSSGGGWDPTIWGSALIAVAGLALAVAWFVASAVMQAPAPPSCISYRPAAVRASDQNEKLQGQRNSKLSQICS